METPLGPPRRVLRDSESRFRVVARFRPVLPSDKVADGAEDCAVDVKQNGDVFEVVVKNRW